MIFSGIVIILLTTACSAINANRQSKIKQGITGRVTIQSGNYFPSPNRPTPKPKGLMTVVYVYEKTNIIQTEIKDAAPLFKLVKSKLITQTNTDSAGYFKIALPIGSYSLFVKKGNAYYANNFDKQNNINVFIVEKKKVTTVSINDNSGTTQ